jgi:hypothetical protein
VRKFTVAHDCGVIINPDGFAGSRLSEKFFLCEARLRSPVHRKGTFALAFAGDITPKYNLVGHAFGGALLWQRNASSGG